GKAGSGGWRRWSILRRRWRTSVSSGGSCSTCDCREATVAAAAKLVGYRRPRPGTVPSWHPRPSR
ncbi:unnamed protein product, partial [Ectocarpus sp. 13 AM-2016]